MPELIDKQAVLEIAMCYCPDDDGSCSMAGHDIREMIDEIKALPTIEAEPVRHGRWIPDNSHLPSNKFTCSECGNIIKTNHYCRKCYLNYCDNCGAKMDLRTPTEVQLDEADSVMMGGAENG